MSEIRVSGEELRQLISDAVQIHNIRGEAQFEIINHKLDGINEHLKKLNGKVVEHERIINERSLVIQQMIDFKANLEEENLPKKVRDLEDVQLTTKTIRNWVKGSIGMGIAVGGLVVAVIAIFF